MREIQQILIGTKNPHKREKISEIVSGILSPRFADSLPEPEETAGSFLAVAEQKAVAYSRADGGLAVATDGGAVFPGLKGWDPLKTKRFVEGTDSDRIAALLEMLSGSADRTVEWHEAIAVADRGRLIFSTTARAMDGQVSESFNPKFYRPGIWLCSITEFPAFSGRNYFELTEREQAATEDSWTELGRKTRAFLTQMTEGNVDA
jgi:inosine/xanthosine triphosphate pyrophosphatase family protein